MGRTTQRRDLAGACLAHMLHDGYTDQLYALLPLWQLQMGLTYAGLAVVRLLYFGTMGALQIPGDKLLGRRVSARTALVLATFVAALGFVVVALPGGLPVLSVGLVIAGVGSSTQHPRASLLVTSAYGREARGPLGIYNFAGDLGKAALPALVSLLLPVIAWRSVVALTAVLGLVVTLVLLLLVPRHQATAAAPVPESSTSTASAGMNAVARQERGFRLLLVVGALDTAPRMGYLLFLPFLLHARGGTDRTVGLGLALLFLGGALGKAVCGGLGARLGVVATVVVTEVATALFVIATLLLPLGALLVVLPPLGIVLNGTSSVLYGTVPDLAPLADTGRACARFYTGVIVTGGLAPIAYGALADHTSRAVGIAASALTALAIVPLILALRPALSRVEQS